MSQVNDLSLSLSLSLQVLLEGIYFYLSLKVTEKNGDFEGIWEQHQVVLVFLLGFLLAIHGLDEKRKREM